MSITYLKGDKNRTIPALLYEIAISMTFYHWNDDTYNPSAWIWSVRLFIPEGKRALSVIDESSIQSTM